MTTPSVPLFLCGTQKELRRNWPPVLARSLKLSSIAQAVDGEEFIPVNKAPGRIIMSNPRGPLYGENLMLYRVVDDLVLGTYVDDREQWYRACKKLILDGMEEFWVSLSMLAYNIGLPITSTSKQEAPQVCAYMLMELLHWWPQFIELDDRFYTAHGVSRSWPSWSGATWSLARGIGKDGPWIQKYIQQQNPEDAAQSLWGLVHST